MSRGFLYKEMPRWREVEDLGALQIQHCGDVAREYLREMLESRCCIPMGPRGGEEFVTAHSILVGLNPFESIRVFQVGHLNHVGLFKCLSTSCISPVLTRLLRRGVLIGLPPSMFRCTSKGLLSWRASTKRCPAWPRVSCGRSWRQRNLNCKQPRQLDRRPLQQPLMSPFMTPRLSFHPSFQCCQICRTDASPTQTPRSHGWPTNITARYLFKRTLYI